MSSLYFTAFHCYTLHCKNVNASKTIFLNQFSCIFYRHIWLILSPREAFCPPCLHFRPNQSILPTLYLLKRGHQILNGPHKIKLRICRCCLFGWPTVSLPECAHFTLLNHYRDFDNLWDLESSWSLGHMGGLVMIVISTKNWEFLPYSFSTMWIIQTHYFFFNWFHLNLYVKASHNMQKNN